MLKLILILVTFTIAGCAVVPYYPEVRPAAPLIYVEQPKYRAHSTTCWRQHNGVVCTKNW